ncbi:MAG: methylmalonyl-CoA carboxyltransferase [Elusimicrobia bacterium HGW-Elusimicrobia-1]|jgi:acetyl-CoA carboxylase carboxyltransferase component|nr:MAG: methylmalonyl-CoA carboxyltransferase [Elusimicrobia bacterium HGW-Elusimicrobia-1]
MNTQKRQELKIRRAEAEAMGGAAAVEKQKKGGKLTARERLAELFDKDSFVETGAHVRHRSTDFGLDKKVIPADGVVTGFGAIAGRKVAAFAQDFTSSGGSLGEMHAAKITKIMDFALAAGIPLIGINDSGGARIQEGIKALAGYGEIFLRNTRASGVIPQISVILGPCAGGAVYSPALTDFVFTVDKVSKMFITGPEVIKTVLGEEISMEDLGGALVQNDTSGNAHFFASTEKECFAQVRELLSYLSDVPAPSAGASAEISGIVPADPKKPYDVRDLIAAVADGGKFLEVQKHFAANIVVGFARLDGKSVGVIANQPKVLAGVLDVDSSDKAARFIRFCDAFGIPLVTLVDMPGYLPGVDQEHAGVIRHGAKMLYAYSEATVAKLTVILRKAYGGGYIAMCSRHLGADFVFAYPTAEIAVMGPLGAANIIFKKEIESSADPEKTRQEKMKEYADKFASPYVAAALGYVDDVIYPEETREKLIAALSTLKNKKTAPSPRPRKHGNIPL